MKQCNACDLARLDRCFSLNKQHKGSNEQTKYCMPSLHEPRTFRLNDQSTMVRIYAIKVLTNLILHDMIKVKGHVSEMAKCIADEDTQIAMLAKRFFQELSKKVNQI